MNTENLAEINVEQFVAVNRIIQNGQKWEIVRDIEFYSANARDAILHMNRYAQQMEKDGESILKWQPKISFFWNQLNGLMESIEALKIALECVNEGIPSAY